MPYFLDTNNSLHYLSEQDIFNGGENYLPQNCTQIPEAEAELIQSPLETLTQAQEKQIDIIQAAYDAAIQVSVTYTTVAGVEKTYQADSDSQAILLTSFTGYNAIGSVPDGFYWIASDNVEVPFSVTDLRGLYSAMLTQGQKAFIQKTTLKRAIQEATTVEAVKAIIWPTTTTTTTDSTTAATDSTTTITATAATITDPTTTTAAETTSNTSASTTTDSTTTSAS